MTVALNYAGDETLENFPVLVKLPASVTREMAEGGADLRFATQAWEPLSYEIDAWDTNGVSKVWVKIPALVPGASILAFWGKADAEAASNPGATWSENYVGVWHMNGADNVASDSSPNANDMTKTGSTVAFGPVGIVGNAAQYATVSSSGHLIAKHTASMADISSNLTIEAWVYDISAAAETVARGIVSKRTTSADTSFALIRSNNSTGTGLYMMIGSVFVALGETTARNDWTSVAVTYDGTRTPSTSRVRWMRDGRAGATPTVSSGTIGTTVRMNTSPMNIGILNANYSPYGGWHGRLDEIRVSSVVRSDAWLKASYDTIASDAFAVCGTPQDNTEGEIPSVAINAATDVTYRSAVIPGAMLSVGDGAPFDVWLYWGTSNGFENVTDWNGARVQADVSGVGAFSVMLDGLAAETAYWARYSVATDSEVYWSAGTISFATAPVPLPELGDVTVVSLPTTGSTISVNVIEPGPNATLSISWKRAEDETWTAAAPIAVAEAGINTFTLPGTQHRAAYDYAITLENDFGTTSTDGSFSVVYVFTWIGASGTHAWDTAANWDLNLVPNSSGDEVIFPDKALVVDISAMDSLTLGKLTFDGLSGGRSVTIRSTDEATPVVFDNGDEPARITITTVNTGAPAFRAPVQLVSDTYADITRTDGRRLCFYGDVSGDGALILERGSVAFYADAGKTSRITVPLRHVAGTELKYFNKIGEGTVVIEGGVHSIPLAVGYNQLVVNGGPLVFSDCVVTNTGAAELSWMFWGSGNSLVVSNNAHLVYANNMALQYYNAGNTIEVVGATLEPPQVTVNSSNNKFLISDGGTVRLRHDHFYLRGSKNLFRIGSTAATPSTFDLNAKTLFINDTEPSFVCAAGGIVTNGNITVGGESTATLNARLVLQGGDIFCNTLIVRAEQILAPVLSAAGLKPIVAKTATFAAGARIAPLVEDGFTPGTYPILTAGTLNGFDDITFEASDKYRWRLALKDEADGRKTILLSCHTLQSVIIVR